MLKMILILLINLNFAQDSTSNPQDQMIDQSPQSNIKSAPVKYECQFLNSDRVLEFYNASKVNSIESCQNQIGFGLLGRAFPKARSINSEKYREFIETGSYIFKPKGKSPIECHVKVKKEGGVLPNFREVNYSLSDPRVKTLIEKHLKFECEIPVA